MSSRAPFNGVVGKHSRKSSAAAGTPAPPPPDAAWCANQRRHGCHSKVPSATAVFCCDSCQTRCSRRGCGNQSYKFRPGGYCSLHCQQFDRFSACLECGMPSLDLEPNSYCMWHQPGRAGKRICKQTFCLKSAEFPSEFCSIECCSLPALCVCRKATSDYGKFCSPACEAACSA